MLCIKHHNTAQTCALCINKARCGTSMTQAVHHALIWLSTAWLITLILPLSTFFFATLFAVNTWKNKKKNKFTFLVAVLLPYCWQVIITTSLARAMLKKDRKNTSKCVTLASSWVSLYNCIHWSHQLVFAASLNRGSLILIPNFTPFDKYPAI